MGACLGRDHQVVHQGPTSVEDSLPSPDLTEDGLARDTAQVQSLTVIENTSLEVSAHDDKIQVVSREDIDHLVLQTLFLTRFLVDNSEAPPPPLEKLGKIADQELGWLNMVKSMIDVIPIDDPLGPATISLLLDECPLPAKETILKLSQMFDSLCQVMHPRIHRNIAITIGFIAEMLAGPQSVALFTPQILDYLISNLDPEVHPSVILFSLIALEKFSQTSENKVTVLKRFGTMEKHPLLFLESWSDDESDFNKRQVGFCAKYCLDNLFIVSDRTLSYKKVDVSNINVMLNSQDVSEYLKIASTGLEARCDAHSFESVRCTFQVKFGCWFYEVLIITPGVMQIGWATKDSKFLNHDGHGIGDDKCSVAIDGCRQLLWYNAQSESQSGFERCWRPGDMIGSLLDVDKEEVIFYHNGKVIQSSKHIFVTKSSGFFAAASFMSFQQCLFNFGSTPFKFPPKRKFQAFNDQGHLEPEEKVILPRHLALEMLSKHTINEDACIVCFDAKACMELLPCGHQGFCYQCSTQLESICPMCRGHISSLNRLSGTD